MKKAHSQISTLLVQEQQTNQFLSKQLVSKHGDIQSEVQEAFTGLNRKRKEIAFEEKQRVEKHNADLN
jgi:hypothetical protein